MFCYAKPKSTPTDSTRVSEETAQSAQRCSTDLEADAEGAAAAGWQRRQVAWHIVRGERSSYTCAVAAVVAASSPYPDTSSDHSMRPRAPSCEQVRAAAAAAAAAAGTTSPPLKWPGWRWGHLLSPLTVC